MSQLVPWAVFCLLVLALCILLPRTARTFVGVFFLIMAVGVNWTLSVLAPDLFVGLGTDAPLLAPYRWFFEHVVALAPPAFGLAAGVGEIVLGCLMLAHGRAARLGLLGGALFLVAITPLGVWTLPNPLLAAGLVVLARRRWTTSAWQDVRGLFDRSAHRPEKPAGTAAR
jgi:hypothetical protein